MSLSAPHRPSDVPRQPATTTVVLMRGDEEVAEWTVACDGPPDLAVIDQLARWQLAARRLGCTIRLRRPSRQLGELLDLSGLAEVVACVGGLVVEVGGEAEGAEEVGVEEAVEPGDPVA
jgi:hypothetical protein